MSTRAVELERNAPPEEEGGAPVWRRLAAEFVGTLLLVAVGSGAATLLVAGPVERVAETRALLEEQAQQAEEGGADPAQVEEQLGQQLTFVSAPLENTFGDVLSVALAFATILAVLVYAFGGISGGHFNPAVSFALAVGRRFSWGHVPLYWIAQIAGGIVGALVIAGIYGQTGASVAGQDILFGATVVDPDLSQWQAILAETVVAFTLMTAIMAVAVDPRAPKGWSGLIIGFGLAAGILVTASATGGSANFARSLGPFVASLLYDTGDIPWDDLVVYAAGPLIGAAAAALVYESLTGLELVSPAPQPGAATPPGEAHLEGHDHDHDHDHDHGHGPGHDHRHDEVAPTRDRDRGFRP